MERTHSEISYFAIGTFILFIWHYFQLKTEIISYFSEYEGIFDIFEIIPTEDNLEMKFIEAQR